MNPAVAKALNYSAPGELVGRHVDEALTSDTNPIDIYDRIKQQLDSGQVRVVYTHCFHRHIVSVLVTSFPWAVRLSYLFTPTFAGDFDPVNQSIKSIRTLMQVDKPQRDRVNEYITVQR